MPRFANKVAIVTGSSNGIGRATAILFAKEGAKVTITGRDANALKVTKSECLKVGAKEEDIVEVLGDITMEDVQNNLVKKTIDKFGKLNILVNNHGGAHHEVNEEGTIDMNTFDPTFDQNCKSTLALTLKAIPYLKASKGEVVNVSSIASLVTSKVIPVYGMAKAALDHSTRILAYRYAKDGIRVNAVNPGIISTAFLSKLGATDEMQTAFEQAFLDADVIPLGRIGTPTDIAEPIAFLADRHASGYMTGQTIFVDGGVTIQHSLITVDTSNVFAEKTKPVQ